MNILVSSVTRGDRVPKFSAEKSLSFVSSMFKPLSRDLKLGLQYHIKRQLSTQLAGKASQPWNFLSCYLLHGRVLWLQTQVTGKATWPMSCAGLGPHGGLALPYSWHACQGWNVRLHTEREIMCQPGICPLRRCLHQSLPVNPCFLGRSHKVSLCC